MAANTDKIQYNQLPRPTFRWMKVNYLELDRLPEQKARLTVRKKRHDGDVSVNFYDGNGIPDLGDFKVPMRKPLKVPCTRPIPASPSPSANTRRHGSLEIQRQL